MMLLPIFMGCSPLITPTEWSGFTGGATIEDVRVSPAEPVLIQEVECVATIEFTSTDAQSDSEMAGHSSSAVEYRWYLDDKVLSGETSSILDLSKYLIEETMSISCGIQSENLPEVLSVSVQPRVPDCFDGEESQDYIEGYCQGDIFPDFSLLI